jgi:membrane fusion protein (multidrug efflux system)
MNRKYAIGILVILAVVILIAWKLAGNKNKLDEKNRPVKTIAIRIPVNVAAVKEQLMKISILKTGSLAPFKEVKVLSVTSGIVRQLPIELGDHVRQGQQLALMDTRLLQIDLQKSEVNQAKLKNDLQTYTELFNGNAATQEKVNEVRQNYTDQVNQSDHLRKQIADGAIQAPTSGIISVKSVEEGAFVNAGADIATIVNLSKAKVQVNLGEAEVYLIKEGQEVKITTDVYPNKIFNGKVSFISPQADAVHNYLVEIIVDNTQQSILRSGTFVYADFSKNTKQQMLVIPRESLTASIKDASVFVVENSVVHQRAIKTGIETNGMIQVLDGLKQGEQVVVSGQINLRDGTAVDISK